ncbi:MAG: redoxin family protein [Longimonas sp.]|uniref:redoxin family protein n=1 Tax=Longimonas sp. TaxID=2039626 RepID=UPI003975A9FC
MRTLSAGWLLPGMLLISTLLLGAHPAHAQTDTLSLGSSLPEATLYDVQEEASVSTDALQGQQATVVLFWSNQCLWIDRYEERVLDLRDTFAERGVQFVFVNANDAEAFTDEGRRASAEQAQSYGDLRYVRDGDATFARQLGAERTPHAFLFDAEGTLVYRGAVDDSPGSPDEVEAAYLREAIQATLNGESVPEADTRPFGCMLKPPR